MRLFEYLREKRQLRREYLKDALDTQQAIAEKKIEAIHDVVRREPLLAQRYSMFYGVSKDDEPFGWPRGTVRGIITIWIVLAFCIYMIFDVGLGLNNIPVEWLLGIVGAVIMSYFYTRYKKTNGG